jgi:ADP-heptose:LPS heptosyltransferase
VEVAERPQLLVLRALGLGDLLTAVPALRALRHGLPRHELVLAAPRAVAPLALCSGAVDRVVDTTPLQAIDVAAPDVAVNLHGRGPQSHRLLLRTQPRRLVAYAHHAVPQSDGMPAWRDAEHETARWCRLVAEAFDVDADPLDLGIDPAGLLDAVRPPAVAHGATIVHPGAAFPARRWPPERWAEVARAEVFAGRHVVVTGSAGEAELARQVAWGAGLPEAQVLAGRTDLLQLAAAVAVADRVACADTGVAHLATALGTPSVVLFGPTPPALWGPPPRPIHHVLWRGGRGDPRAQQPDPGLLAIEVDEVLEALRTLPARPGRPGLRVDVAETDSMPITYGGDWHE